MIGLGTGRILLLSDPGSFTAAYIRRSAAMLAVPLLECEGAAKDGFAKLSGDDLASISGCIAADVGPALFADITKDARHIPCLFVGHASGGWFPGPYAWLAPPFSSYQIMETLAAMIAANPRNDEGPRSV